MLPARSGVVSNEQDRGVLMLSYIGNAISQGHGGVLAIFGTAAAGFVSLGIWAGAQDVRLIDHGRRLDNQYVRIERLELAVPTIREDLREIKTLLRFLTEQQERLRSGGTQQRFSPDRNGQ